ncbi:MAG TPA: hypothetical protein VGD64_03280 [Acidisarcina sp.]
MTLSERLYGLLLGVFPSSFLAAYREPMQQAFRDQLRECAGGLARLGLWAHTLRDLAGSAAAAHVREGTLPALVGSGFVYLLAMAGTLLLGRLELHTDDDGVVVGFILAGSFVLGCLRPRRAWLWSCFGLCVPLVDHVWATPQRPAMGAGGTALLAAFVLFVGSVGSWSAFLLRRMARS